jgi:hypothetical protein
MDFGSLFSQGPALMSKWVSFDHLVQGCLGETWKEDLAENAGRAGAVCRTGVFPNEPPHGYGNVIGLQILHPKQTWQARPPA